MGVLRFGRARFSLLAACKVLVPAVGIAVLFQNCSGGFRSGVEDQAAGSSYCVSTPSDPTCQEQPKVVCDFNGQEVGEGASVTAFLNSSVPNGQTCQSETRVCHDGALSGSFNFASCQPDQPKACLFNGQTVAHGQSIKAYLKSTVPFGSTCQEESRTCTDGVLSGSYSYGSCAVDQPAACLFNGKTIAHGQSVTAFDSSSVPYGKTCAPQTRTCYNGALTGHGDYASCVVDEPASCLFNGMTVAHLQKVTAYATSTVPYGQKCSPVVRTCNNGVLSGQGNYASCRSDAPAACLVNGMTVPHGGSISLYLKGSVDITEQCASESRVCDNGVLSGSATFGSCTTNAVTINPSRTRFHILWLEPLKLRATRGAVTTMGVTSGELRAMVQNYKRLGFYTLVVAYTEYADYFMYKAGSFSYYSKDLGQTVKANDAARNYGLLADGGDFLSVLMDEARLQNLKVILGLGRTGDLNLVIDMATKANGGTVSEPSGNTISDRVARVNQAARDLAHDLYVKFGGNPAFGGWYLSHETHCIDQGMRLYAPVATYLRSLTPAKDVMISPTPNATSCDSKKTLLQVVDENKNLVNIYAYQDAIGAGARFINGISSYQYTDSARAAAISDLIPVFNNLKLIHAQTGTFFWVNTEAWRMDGPTYGNSYPGAWSGVKTQMNQWAALSPYVGNLMLNEGFLMFDFGIEDAKLRDSASQQKAAQFTRDYLLYLK